MQNVHLDAAGSTDVTGPVQPTMRTVVRAGLTVPHKKEKAMVMKVLEVCSKSHTSAASSLLCGSCVSFEQL